jgi:hypothetical protein
MLFAVSDDDNEADEALEDRTALFRQNVADSDNEHDGSGDTISKFGEMNRSTIDAVFPPEVNDMLVRFV